MKFIGKLVFCLIFLSTAGMAASLDWEKTDDGGGIEIFKKDVPGSPIIAFKGQGMIDAPISKVATVVLDTKRAPEWVPHLDEIKVLRRVSDHEHVEYNHIGTPFVMKDRDFVLRRKFEADPKAKVIKIEIHSIEDSAAPQTNYIRGEIINSSFTLKSVENDTKTYVITEIHADPKGTTAKWLVNSFQKEMPRDILRSLRKQVLKPDVEEDPFYKELFKEQASKN
ncbi:MAG: START domain-containing protein [Bdellovibrionia bacterium]